jgi:hypothetical protein
MFSLLRRLEPTLRETQRIRRPTLRLPAGRRRDAVQPRVHDQLPVGVLRVRHQKVQGSLPAIAVWRTLRQRSALSSSNIPHRIIFRRRPRPDRRRQECGLKEVSGATARTPVPKHSRYSWTASEQVPKLRLSVELLPKFQRPTDNGFRPSYSSPVPIHTRCRGWDQARSLP